MDFDLKMNWAGLNMLKIIVFVGYIAKEMEWNEFPAKRYIGWFLFEIPGKEWGGAKSPLSIPLCAPMLMMPKSFAAKLVLQMI